MTRKGRFSMQAINKLQSAGGTIEIPAKQRTQNRPSNDETISMLVETEARGTFPFIRSENRSTARDDLFRRLQQQRQSVEEALTRVAPFQGVGDGFQPEASQVQQTISPGRSVRTFVPAVQAIISRRQKCFLQTDALQPKP